MTPPSTASAHRPHTSISDLVATSIRLTEKASEARPGTRAYSRLCRKEEEAFNRIVRCRARNLSDIESRLALAVRMLEIAEEDGPVLDLIRAALRDAEGLAWQPYV